MLEGLRRGDREAAARLYAWYGDALFREIILPRMPRREVAEDVLRDTFRILLERIHQFEPQGDRSIYFWILRIAVNRVTDVQRAEARRRRLEDAVEAEARVHAPAAEEPDLDGNARHAAIEAAFAQLNPRYAEALRLRLLQDLPRDVCAERLGVTVGNFDVIFFRASAAFRGVYREPT